MRVGDVEIRSHSGTVRVEGRPTGDPLGYGGDEERSLPARLPGHAGWWIGSGAVLAAASLLMGGLTVTDAAPASPLPGWGFLAGLGLFVLGMTSAKHRQRAARRRRERLERELGPITARLRIELDRAEGPCTVEDLVRKTGFREREVVVGLAWMRDDREIVEELDMDSGIFRYRLPRPGDDALRVGDLDERLERYEGGGS